MKGRKREEWRKEGKTHQLKRKKGWEKRREIGKKEREGGEKRNAVEEGREERKEGERGEGEREIKRESLFTTMKYNMGRVSLLPTLCTVKSLKWK